MPPIEVGASAAIAAIPARLTRPAVGANSSVTPNKPGAAAPSVEKSAALEPGSPPIDADRVATIRKALENGTYPLIPTRIADAMIAASALLRSPV